MLWLTNRARRNPTREGIWLARSKEFSVGFARDYFRVNRTALLKAFSRIRPRPPAAFDVRLYRAALAHTKVQIQKDVQDHIGQVERIDDEGFYWDQIRYNVFSFADNALNAHAGFNIDWGPGTSSGMQQPPHHRLGVMSVDGEFSNVGIAGLRETNPGTRVGQYVVSQNFCRAASDRPDHYNAFIVGTVWRDANANDRYDPGEGIPNVTVSPSLGDYFAVTSNAGGYAIPVTQSGRMQVRFSGPSIEAAQYDVSAADVSVLLDHKLNANGSAANIFRVDGRAGIYLSRGVADPRRFGNKWGNDSHERSISATFDNSPVDLLLTMQSHHINRAGEAQVFVNGQSLGFLRAPSGGKKYTKERFIVPAALLSHTNKLEIRQRYNGEKWGVEKLKLTAATSSAAAETIKPGVTAAGPFGWGVGGRPHRALYRIAFDADGTDMDLEFEAHDVKFSQDLEVLINGKRAVWVARNTGKEGYVRVNVPVSVLSQQDGSNIIEFRSHRSTQWGVRNIQLRRVAVAQIGLKRPDVDKRRFGWRFPGGRHRTIVRRGFKPVDGDLVLSLRANFADRNDAVVIFVNDNPVGQIRASESGRTHQFSIPAALQRSKENYIEFRRHLRTARAWHVSDMQLKVVANPSILLNREHGSVQMDRQFGWRWGEREHRTIVRAQFNVGGAAKDLLLTSKGFNITSAKQVLVLLNDVPLGYISVAAGKLGAGDNFVLPARLQHPGMNVIEFRNRSVDVSWGITGLALKAVRGPTLTLAPGITDYRRYATSQSSKFPASVVNAEFYSTGEDMNLEVIGYDIEASEKVDVYLNGTKVGRLATSLNDGHSTGEHIFIPMRLQQVGKNTIQFRRVSPHSRWGVTSLGLMPLNR